MLIYDLLPQGKENSIASSELCKLTGATSTRELQKRIERERSEGYLILSTCKNGGGYFKCDDGEKGRHEIAEFVATLRNRAINTLRALKAAKQALEAVEGQIALEELNEQ